MYKATFFSLFYQKLINRSLWKVKAVKVTENKQYISIFKFFIFLT